MVVVADDKVDDDEDWRRWREWWKKNLLKERTRERASKQRDIALSKLLTCRTCADVKKTILNKLREYLKASEII